MYMVLADPRCVYDCEYGDFPAKHTKRIPHIRINVWFWPSLFVWCGVGFEGQRRWLAQGGAGGQIGWYGVMFVSVWSMVW
jgi:hypothetical protein